MTKVRDVMTKDVLTVYPETPIRDYLALVRERGFSGLPVLDLDRRAVGMVSQSDVLRGLVAFLGDRPLGDGLARRRIDLEDLAEAIPEKIAGYLTQTVQTVMEQGLIRTTPDASMVDACKAMNAARVRRIIVEDGEALVGILSATDVVRHVAARG